MPEFELVVPSYNESQTLPAFIERVRIAAQNYGYTSDSFQLVLVENGSTDSSRIVLEQLKEKALGPWFRVVRVEVNQGYGYGLWSGLQITHAPYVAWSHADMQCDPSDAFNALELLKRSGYTEKTLVKGVRAGRNWKDIIISRVFEFLALIILGKGFYEINAQPKVFPRRFLDTIKNPPYGFAFDLYALYCAAKQGFNVQTITVDFPPRIYGAF